jgi:hypothetical protein
VASFVSRDLDQVSSALQAAITERGETLLSIDRLEGALSSLRVRMDDRKLVSVAYHLSATFIAWWVEHFGMWSVRTALVGIGQEQSPKHAIGAATGVPLHKIEQEWRRHMLANSLSPKTH